MPPDGPASGMIAETLPGLLFVHGRVLGTVCWTGASRTICTMLVRYNWAVISCLLHVTLLVDHPYANYSPCRGGTIFLLQYFMEDLSHHFFRLFAARFDVFSAYSVVVTRFAFFEAVDGRMYLIFWELRNFTCVVITLRLSRACILLSSVVIILFIVILLFSI